MKILIRKPGTQTQYRAAFECQEWPLVFGTHSTKALGVTLNGENREAVQLVMTAEEARALAAQLTTMLANLENAPR